MKNRFTKKIIIALQLFLIVNNQQNCYALQINEVLPNPTGRDQNKEWIELYNETDQPVDLNQYQLQTGKKSAPLPNIQLQSKKHFILQGKSLKIPLKNSANEIKLVDQNNSLISEISYPTAKENLSFSHITISNPENGQKHHSYTWTKPSKNKANAKFLIFTGKVQDLTNELVLQTANSPLAKIAETSKTIKIPAEQKQIINNTVQIGDKIQILVQESPQELSLIKLKILEKADYQNPETKKNNQSNRAIQISIFITAIIVLIYFLWHYKASVQNPLSSSDKKN